MKYIILFISLFNLNCASLEQKCTELCKQHNESYKSVEQIEMVNHFGNWKETRCSCSSSDYWLD